MEKYKGAQRCKGKSGSGDKEVEYSYVEER